MSLAGARDERVRASDWIGLESWRGAGAAFFCIIVVTAVDLFRTIQLHLDSQSFGRPTTHNLFPRDSAFSIWLFLSVSSRRLSVSWPSRMPIHLRQSQL